MPCKAVEAVHSGWAVCFDAAVHLDIQVRPLRCCQVLQPQAFAVQERRSNRVARRRHLHLHRACIRMWDCISNESACSSGEC